MPRAPIHRDDDRLRAMWMAGRAADVIADALGYSAVKSVNARARALGLPPRSRNARTDAQRVASMQGAWSRLEDRESAFRADWLAGVASDVLAARYGFGTGNLATCQGRRLGLPKRSRYALTDAERVASMADPGWQSPGRSKAADRKPVGRKPAAPAGRVVVTARDLAPVAAPPRVLACAKRRRAADAAPLEPALAADVLQTGGRYAALSDVAARHGLTQARALQVWHRVRGGA